MASDTDSALSDPIEVALQAIANLRAEHQRGASAIQRASNHLTSFLAQTKFLALLSVLVLTWIGVNVLMRAGGAPSPDPWPFPALQTAAAIFAVYMTLFILIAQRRDDELSELREALTLQLAILGEQRTAKLVQLVQELRRDLPIVPDLADPEAEGLAQSADTEIVAGVLRDRINAKPGAASG